MIIALYIIIAIIFVTALAYIVVNKIPKKFHWIISLLLLLLIVILSVKIVGSIKKPIKFAKEKQKRYTQVIKNLKLIRDAEVAYIKNNNVYTADKNALINFIDKDSFPIVEVYTEQKKVNRGGGIFITIDERVEKITGYTPVRAGFAGRDYKNMFKVPGTDKIFDLKVDSVMKIEDIMSSTFLAQVDKADVLHGMDDYLVAEEKEAIGGTQVKGKFIAVGALEDVKITGNWPPIYDGKKNKEKK